MNYMYLNRFFTKKVLIEKISDKEFNKELFLKELNENYSVLENQYRNEFFFKNVLFNKYLLGRYSLNTTVALSEVVIGKSKADFCIINKQRGMLFEIKTDLDNLERLVNQISDYYKVFSYVTVVTTENNYYPVWRVVKEHFPTVGIIVLTDRITLSERKQAILNSSYLEYSKIFKLLRKNEYEQLIRMKFDVPIDVRPVEHYKLFYSYFKKIDILEAQKMVFSILKRRICLKDKDKLTSLPDSVRWLLYSANLKDNEFKEIKSKLKD